MNRRMRRLKRILEWLLPEPMPCVCGCGRIYTVFVGGGYDGLLQFWVRMECAACGRRTKKKLFRSRAVRAWNRMVSGDE